MFSPVCIVCNLPGERRQRWYWLMLQLTSPSPSSIIMKKNLSILLPFFTTPFACRFVFDTMLRSNLKLIYLRKDKRKRKKAAFVTIIWWGGRRKRRRKKCQIETKRKSTKIRRKRRQKKKALSRSQGAQCATFSCCQLKCAAIVLLIRLIFPRWIYQSEATMKYYSLLLLFS